jgi:AcrR family transcriptional regulator
MPRPRTVSDEAILVATAQVIGEVGPDRLTLGDVGRRVGLSPATLLQRFGSRRGLLLALATHDVDAIPGRIRSAASASGSVLDALVAELVEMASQITDPAQFGNHLAFLLLDLSDPEFQAVARHYGTGMFRAIRDVLTSAAARGELAASVDTVALAGLVHVVYNGALVTWGMAPDGTSAVHVERHLQGMLEGFRATNCHA